MGINGIDNLKGYNMNESNDPQVQQGQAIPGSQQDESAGQPPTATPPTPAHEETDRVTPDAQDQDDAVVEKDVPEPEVQIDPDAPAEATQDNEVQTPANLPEESYNADPSDQHGQEV